MVLTTAVICVILEGVFIMYDLSAMDCNCIKKSPQIKTWTPPFDLSEPIFFCNFYAMRSIRRCRFKWTLYRVQKARHHCFYHLHHRGSKNANLLTPEQRRNPAPHYKLKKYIERGRIDARRSYNHVPPNLTAFSGTTNEASST